MSTRSIPHHRVDARLYQDAKLVADAHGVSMSAVAVAGLRRFVAATPAGVDLTSGMPTALARELTALAASNSKALDERIIELHAAGWSYAAIAAPLTLTRQAVHMRARKAGGASDRTSRRDVFDWAVWVSPDLYRDARTRAEGHGTSMRALMERVLRDFVDGDLEVANADVAPITTDKQETR